MSGELELPAGTRLLLYDGVCGLCNRAIQLTLPRDRHGRLRYAALQSELGRRVLERHGRDPAALDTVYLVLDPGLPSERLLSRARAAVETARTLGGIWGVLARLASVLPWALLDAAYGFVARRRYRWFGRDESCPLPPPEERHRFLG